MRTQLRFILVTGFVLGLLAFEDLPPELGQLPETIPVPTNVSIQGGSQSATISWESDAEFEYAEFAVFRSEDGVAYAEIARQAAPPFIDTDLRVGVTYFYRIAGVDVEGVIGRASTPVPVTVAIYEVLVNGGASLTRDLDVTLNFTAPAFSQNVRVSEDASLAGAQWLD